MTRRYDRPLTPDELAALPDTAIDTSDIPALDEAFFREAAVVPPRTKPNVSLRIAEDAIAFFKAENPKGYTARMAAVLEAYAAHQRAQQQR